ncbi:hypothetical protein PENANT_c014G10933 [Penicillium antarcticum]|uniref:Uncharacterized protein n=1 Tax=Penicillium antarcticum TaxID=416450 RepID=A0A1V6Q479_9EURO|nr:hypothetical protein PENANT_c014G10933 [Penicillium antarcticum]
MSNTLEARQAEAAQTSSSAESSSVANSSWAAAVSSSTLPSVASSSAGVSDSTKTSTNPSATPDTSSVLPTATTSSGLIPTSPAPSSSRPPSNTPSTTNIPNGNAQSSSLHKSGYSGGTLAGAIVGSIAGTLLLALLAFVLLRHRRKRNHPDAMAQNSTISVTTETPKQPTQIQSRSFGVTSATSRDAYPQIAPAVGLQHFDLASYMPIPADDNTVSTKIQTLFDQASLHIDNYYSHANPTLQITPEVVACMNKFDSPFLSSPLATLLANPRSKRAALTHTLVRALLQGIQPGSQTWSLLPPCYTMNLDKKEISGNMFDDHRAMFAWPFAPYIDANFTVEDQLDHLTSVVRAAADLGTWLFSQPCSFGFRWTSLVTPLDQVIIFPAVFKDGDEQGRPLRVPHTLVEETSVRI